MLLDWTGCCLSTAFSLCCFPTCNLSWWELSSRPDQQWWLAANLCVYTHSRSPDEAAHNTRLPDSISSFSCHLGWAVNTNKLIRTILQTWCCHLGGSGSHSHKLLVNSLLSCWCSCVQMKLVLIVALFKKKKGWKNNLFWILPNRCVNQLKWSSQSC